MIACYRTRHSAGFWAGLKLLSNVTSYGEEVLSCSIKGAPAVIKGVPVAVAKPENVRSRIADAFGLIKSAIGGLDKNWEIDELVELKSRCVDNPLACQHGL
jgi:hypothetical protein